MYSQWFMSFCIDRDRNLKLEIGNLAVNPQLSFTTLISLFEKVHFYIFVMIIELVSVRVLSINLNQKDIGIHSNLKVLQAPPGCLVAAC